MLAMLFSLRSRQGQPTCRSGDVTAVLRSLPLFFHRNGLACYLFSCKTTQTVSPRPLRCCARQAAIITNVPATSGARQAVRSHHTVTREALYADEKRCMTIKINICGSFEKVFNGNMVFHINCHYLLDHI